MRRQMLQCMIAGVALALLVLPTAATAVSEDDVRARMADVNAKLVGMGAPLQLGMVEYLTAWEEQGRTVFFRDVGSQKSSAHWVPGDPRRLGIIPIAWLSDQLEGTANGPTLAETQAAVDRAMMTWEEVTCSNLSLLELPDFGVDWGVVQWLLGFGGLPGWLADVTQAGWLPGAFFDAVFGPGGSDVVIGVTFTFVWIDDEGNPTDIDHNGKQDAAFREIYYNNAFPWGIDSGFPIDVETIVAHESGHGLSQGHFGKLFRTEANGTFHFAPLALMNAGYTGVQQSLSGPDIGGHCSIWASWPHR